MKINKKPNLTRKDKAVISEFEFMMSVSNDGAIPSMKSSSFERVITSNNSSYDNLDGNYRKYTAIKKRYIKKIENILKEWSASLSGEAIVRGATKQCKKAGCPKPNKRVPIDVKFCQYCGKGYSDA